MIGKPTKVSIWDMVKGFSDLGITRGDVLNLKISLKSMGDVENGADGVIDALLRVVGPEGTLVTESFVNSYFFPNLCPTKSLVSSATKSYAGAVANALMRNPGCYFSSHPIHRFAAVGAKAKELMDHHTPRSSAYHVLDEMSQIGGKNLRVGGFDKVIGVGTTHVAITNLGLKQKRLMSGVLFIDEQGERQTFMLNWAGGCAQGFNRMIMSYLDKLEYVKKTKIGDAECMVTMMSETLAHETTLLSQRPDSFFCEDPYCADCRISWAFSPESWSHFLLKCIKNGNYRMALKTIGLQLFSSWHPTG
jgi:aminoglycoside N3'-acetyltransferase